MNQATVAALGLIVLSACSTYTGPRYSMNADTGVALKRMGALSVGLGSFVGPTDFSTTCRLAGPLAPPDGLTHTEYIRRAFQSELKSAGAYSPSASIVIDGAVKLLDFTSSRTLTGGAWNIGIELTSSNGNRLSEAVRYEFESGFSADTACKQTAEAFMPAVQDLILKTVGDPEFARLLTGAAPPVATASAPAALAAATPATAVTLAGESKWRFDAAKVSHDFGCASTGTLSARGPAVETYSFTCTGGDVLSVRCEYGSCRALK